MDESYLTSLHGMAPRQELADEVYELLRAHIMRGTIPPGVRINIEDVARQLNVSPTPVRETLARLESEGLVDRQPRRGYTATELLSRDDVRELYEMRMLLEPYAVERAALGANATFLRQITDELEAGRELAKAGASIPPAELSAHDERFHDLIFRAAGNELIRQSYARTHCHLHIFRLSFSDTFDDHTIAEHGQIVEPLASGNIPAAAEAMRAHIVASEGRVLNYFESQQSQPAGWRNSPLRSRAAG
ncbi:GntR family transcriptional regulator [Arthrobacter sp. GMC3]|uniref:GntR family transcriptional regulator n=1 Tax=Arthrobacter sp. GMC3 TaxID=2058894 RepID=UPI001C67375D|nr:GntR family transcriptional regulator [Arthrobacter sp. GMC3]